MQIKKNLKKTIILASLFITLFTLLCFNFALAQGRPSGSLPDSSSGGVSGQVQLRDPLKVGTGPNALNEFIGRIIKNLLGVVGSLALIMFVVGGLMWLTSAGNDERIKKGKAILTWAALGLVVIFTSYAILKFVLDVLTKQS